jgi:hypothetical protein
VRRAIALIATAILAGALAPSGVAATSVDSTAVRANGFVGDFDVLEQGTERVVARVVVRFTEPTSTTLVPGSLHIYWRLGVTTDPYEGTPAVFGARESHARILRTAFWRDSRSGGHGSEVDGQLCDYLNPQTASCHPFQMGFFVPRSGTAGRHVAFEGTDQWCCNGRWYDVGKGTFRLTYATDTPGFPWYRPPSGTTPTAAADATIVSIPQGSAPAAATPASVSTFMGDVDLLAGSPSRRVGHMVARFQVPTLDRPVPGSLDITWLAGSGTTGSGWPSARVRESHAQLLQASFEKGADGRVHALVRGLMCDYTGPQKASCHGFRMDLAGSARSGGPRTIGFGPSGSCCSGRSYIAGKGTFDIAFVAAPGRERSRHVGASFMTFWGLDRAGTDGAIDWGDRRSDTPLIGEYSSADPAVAERQIATATSHGIDLFFMDFGWIQPGGPYDLAAQSGLLRATNVDQIDVAVLYFPDPVVSWGLGPDRLRSDFAYLAAVYFTHPSYLRVDGHPVVILNGLTAYWSALGVEATDALFAEVKAKYGLYLVAGFHPDADPAALDDGPWDAFMLWGNLWHSLGDDPDGTYTYGQYAAAYRDLWRRWHDDAVARGLQFVPSVSPGFDNVTYTSAPFSQGHVVIERDLAEFTSLVRYAREMTTDPLGMTLFFSWNDFTEGHAIEPSDEYGDAYLKAVETAFPR